MYLHIKRIRRIYRKGRPIHCQHKGKMTQKIKNVTHHPPPIKKKKCKKNKKPKNQTNNHILLISSLIFTTNVVTAVYKQYYVYASLFAILTITSLIFHSNRTLLTNAADKLLISSVVFYGGNMAYKKLFMPDFGIGSGIGIVTTFLGCILFFNYGYICNKYCFDPDYEIGNMYHAILHIIASVGHHMIIMS